MSEIFSEAARVAGEAARSALCAAGGLNRVSNDIAGKINPLYRGSALEGFRDRVSDSLQRFCPVPPGPLPPISQDPPFQGGQCPGVFYGVFYSTLTQQLSEDGTEVVEVPGERSTSGLGPIVSVTSEPVGEETPEGFQGYDTILVSEGGNRETVIVTGPVRSTGIVRVDRADDQPDDCGDPPPDGPPVDPTPPTSPRPPSTPVDIDLPGIGPTTVIYSPTIGIVYADIDGSIRVPITISIDVGGIRPVFDIDFSINLSDPGEEPRPEAPDLPENPDGRPEPGDCPLPEVCGVEPEEEGEDEADPDESEAKGKEITGALTLAVRSGPPIRQTELFQSSGPSVFVPYIGLLTFVYERPDGGIAYSMDIPVKRVQQTFVAPRTGLKVVAARVSWEQGWEGEIFNISAPGCCNT